MNGRIENCPLLSSSIFVNISVCRNPLSQWEVMYSILRLFFISFCIHGSLGDVGDVQCPDPGTKCRDKETCCQLPTKQWGCCPIQHAVCCSDGLHCCPQKTTCNLKSLTCDNATAGDGEVTRTPSLIIRSPAKTSVLTENDVLCPDGKKTCPSGNTCCKFGSKEEWGCCQFPHAVCCPDHVHCCPHGNTCNGSKCASSSDGSDFSDAVNITEKSLLAMTVQCSDGTYCDDHSTCCRTMSGEWGCCPFQNGVCCPDNVHCCPHGTACDAATGYCWHKNGTGGRKWMKKYQSISQGDILCPGGLYKCKGNQTCCQLDGDLYGCCNLKDAICCSDKTRCCPTGTTCNDDGTCGANRSSSSGKSSASLAYAIDCPDHKTKCPSGTTCCPVSDTAYGCCPLPHAVCCEDRLHCCPTGTTCNIEEGACISARGKRDHWFRKFKPISG